MYPQRAGSKILKIFKMSIGIISSFDLKFTKRANQLSEKVLKWMRPIEDNAIDIEDIKDDDDDEDESTPSSSDVYMFSYLDKTKRKRDIVKEFRKALELIQNDLLAYTKQEVNTSGKALEVLFKTIDYSATPPKAVKEPLRTTLADKFLSYSETTIEHILKSFYRTEESRKGDSPEMDNYFFTYSLEKSLATTVLDEKADAVLGNSEKEFMRTKVLPELWEGDLGLLSGVLTKLANKFVNLEIEKLEKEKMEKKKTKKGDEKDDDTDSEKKFKHLISLSDFRTTHILPSQKNLLAKQYVYTSQTHFDKLDKEDLQKRSLVEIFLSPGLEIKDTSRSLLKSRMDFEKLEAALINQKLKQKFPVNIYEEQTRIDEETGELIHLPFAHMAKLDWSLMNGDRYDISRNDCYSDILNDIPVTGRCFGLTCLHFRLNPGTLNLSKK